MKEDEVLALVEQIEDDHTVYASSDEVILRWNKLRSLALNAVAAEERGRRRGIESAASQCATTCDAAPWKERWGAHPPPWVVTRAVRDAIEALAPRDSGPVKVFSRDECPFKYCDQEPPWTACLGRCRHAPQEDRP